MEILEWMDDRQSNKDKKITDYKYFKHIFVGGICLLTLAFAVVYTLLSRTVYFWDDSTYWDISTMLAEKPLNFGFIRDVYNSVCTSDYNYVAAVPIALLLKIFGTSRVAYIAVITALYLIPSQILIYKLCERLSKAANVAFLCTVFSVPSMVYITSIGFIDISGVLVALGCYYLYIDDKRGVLKSALLGILLTLIMVIRRYFAFFSVSFIAVMITEVILFKKNKKNAAVTLIACAGVLVIFFYPFLVNILLKDYGTLYSGYKYDIMTDLKLVTRYYGALFILSIFTAVVVSVIRKRTENIIFAFLQMIVCFLMFISTQTHGQQHLLLYVAPVTVIVISGINFITKRTVFVGMCILSAANLISPCISRQQPQNIQEIKSISYFPSYSVKPKTRSDIYEIFALKAKLDEYIPENKKCGILASSFTVNSSILENVTESLNKKETREDTYITSLPEVDSRDYWRLEELYNVDYILVATPAQTHLANGEQTIIEEAVKSFEANTDVALSFAKAEGFDANVGSVKFKLYARVEEVSESAKTEFELRLYK